MLLKLNLSFLLCCAFKSTAETNSKNFPSFLILSTVEPPLTGSDPSLPITYYGMASYYIVNWLSEQLKFRYLVTSPSDMLFGAFYNGSWNGIIGQLVRKEVDMGVAFHSVSYERYQAIDFTTPVAYDSTGILIPFPEEHTKAMASIAPFPVAVWFSLLAALGATALVLSFEKQELKSCFATFGRKVMYVLSIITGQGADTQEKHAVLRCVTVCWSVLSLVLIGVYTGMLTSFLTVPTFQPIVDSIEDLAASKEVKPITLASNAEASYLMAASDGPYKTVGDVLRKNPDCFVRSSSEAFEKTISGKYVFIRPTLALNSLIDDDWKRTRTCRTLLAKNTFFSRAFAFTLPKGKRKMKAIIDKQIMYMQQFGFAKYFDHRIIRRNRCTIKEKTIVKGNRVLGLRNLSSAFYILLIGTFTSLFVFLMEVCTHKLYTHVAKTD